jgi:putative DNA primase/helicase
MNVFLTLVRRCSGKVVVIEEYKDADNEVVFVLRTPKDLKESFAMWTIPGVGSPATIRLAHNASAWKDRVVFSPQGAAPCDFNLFRGLKIKREDAVEGDVSRFTDHIRDIWCDGDDEAAEYVMNWLAHLIQHVGVKMHTVLVIKGAPGCGKSSIVDMIGRIIGKQSYSQMSSVDDLTGRFQSDTIATNLLTFLDEATFGGDKRQAAQLKCIISETTRRFEQKNVNSISIANHANFIFASNFDHIVSVEHNDRRFMCMEASDKYSGTQTSAANAYFAAIRAVPIEHVAYFLYNRDISKFNPRAIPSTQFRTVQKENSLGSAEYFISNWLREDMDTAYNSETGFKNKRDIYDHYTKWCEGDKYSSRCRDNVFFRKLKKLVGGVDHRAREDGVLVRYLELPSVEDCQAAFASSMGDPTWFD